MKLCECGCGKPAPIATRTEDGYAKGEAKRFRRGHPGRGRVGPRYLIDENGCWIWQRCLNASGYGVIWPTLAHRVYWERVNGLIPQGMQLDHKCRIRACVNPSHLRLVTPAGNSQHRSLHTPGVSPYRGVDRRDNRWRARVTLAGVQHDLGRYDSELEAAEVARRFRAEHMPYSDLDRVDVS